MNGSRKFLTLTALWLLTLWAVAAAYRSYGIGSGELARRYEDQWKAALTTPEARPPGLNAYLAQAVKPGQTFLLRRRLAQIDPIYQARYQAEAARRSETARAPLKTPSPEGWDESVKGYKVTVGPLKFRPNSAEVSDLYLSTVEEVADVLRRWPTYVLEVRGNATAGSDPEAGLALAADRARNVGKALEALGIPPDRIKTIALPAEPASGEARSVAFILRPS